MTNISYMCKCITAFITIFLILNCLTGCTNDSYRETLESGQEKYYSGKPMTEKEYNAVKGFNDWKSKQSSKTYNEWDK